MSSCVLAVHHRQQQEASCFPVLRLTKRCHCVSECRTYFPHVVSLYLPCNLMYLTYWSLFISQGCCSDISSMVQDAQKTVTQTVQRAVTCVGRLAVLTGSGLRLLGSRRHDSAGGQVTEQPELRKAPSEWPWGLLMTMSLSRTHCVCLKAAHAFTRSSRSTNCFSQSWLSALLILGFSPSHLDLGLMGANCRGGFAQPVHPGKNPNSRSCVSACLGSAGY